MATNLENLTSIIVALRDTDNPTPATLRKWVDGLATSLSNDPDSLTTEEKAGLALGAIREFLWSHYNSGQVRKAGRAAQVQEEARIAAHKAELEPGGPRSPAAAKGGN